MKYIQMKRGFSDLPVIPKLPDIRLNIIIGALEWSSLPVYGPATVMNSAIIQKSV